MSKFKVGDRVFCLITKRVGTIKYHTQWGSEVHLFIIFEDGNGSRRSNEIIPFDLYNAPLYQALL